MLFSIKKIGKLQQGISSLFLIYNFILIGKDYDFDS